MVRWAPVILWSALIFWLSSIPNLRMSDKALADLILRKSAHVGEYTVLPLLLYRALSRGVWRKWSWSSAMMALILTVAYAGSVELHQSFVAQRARALVDLAYDSAGAVLGLLIAAWCVWWGRVNA